MNRNYIIKFKKKLLFHCGTRVTIKKKFYYSLPTQQTPNPDAQLPVAVPPFLEHSEEVKHVPLRPVDVVHGVLENRTIEKRDMTNIRNNKWEILDIYMFKNSAYI